MRLTFITLAALALVVAAILAARDRSASTDALPPWIPGKLVRLTVRSGDAKDFRVTRDYAIEAARLRAFVGEGPDERPLSFPTRVTGPVAGTGGLVIPPSGRVNFPKVENAPAWLIVWRGIERGVLNPSGVSQPGDDVLLDAVFFVDGITGVCCLDSLFLYGDSRLG